jgi:HSP90 family molecular chaperone
MLIEGNRHMACDYNAIRTDNKGKYGTDIGRIGPMLLAQRYADRTHFIFELLQNAEDALARRRRGWRGSRAVTFTLESDALRVSHYGEPFDERDVRGICGIAESTKEDFTAIGRFGIGFKSVYAFSRGSLPTQ